MAALTLYASSLMVAAAIAALVAVYAWRQRPEPGASSLSALLVLVAAWCGLYALGLGTTESAARLLVKRLRWVATAFVPVAWTVFALRYTGHESLVDRRRVATLCAIPAVTVALVWLAPDPGLMWWSLAVVDRAGLSIVDSARGPWFWVFFAYAVVLIVFGAGLLVREGLTAADLYADQAASLVVAAAAPTGAALLTNFGVTPVAGLDLTPYGFAVTGLALANAAFRHRLLELVPATRQVGRDAVVRNMRDGVVVLDEADEVVDVNPVATRALGKRREEMLGTPAATALAPIDPGDGDWTGEFVSREAGTTYEVHASPMVSSNGRVVGTILVLRDVTDRRNREQRLTVLNRVLRHNFRNDMNAIDGYATMLAEDLDEPRASTARQIREVTGELVELADKARDIEQLMARRERAPKPVDVDALVESVIDGVRDSYPDVDLTYEGTGDGDVSLPSRGIVEPVVENLVENAAEHNDGPDPTVRVTTTVDRDADPPVVRVAVADDGPGIPPQEREVLLEGTETALKHGSGLGLWLVYWGVQSLDGEITFEDNDPRGSVVEVTVPLGQGRSADAGADELGTLEDAIEAGVPSRPGD